MIFFRAATPRCCCFFFCALPHRFGDVSDLEEYKGGRDFDAMKKFADEKLKVRGPQPKQDGVLLCLKIARLLPLPASRRYDFLYAPGLVLACEHRPVRRRKEGGH
jgi:hypothetical protein